MRRFLHALAHLLRMNCGTVETRYASGHLMVGFRCRGCGRTFHWHCSPRCECRAYRHYS